MYLQKLQDREKNTRQRTYLLTLTRQLTGINYTITNKQ